MQVQLIAVKIEFFPLKIFGRNATDVMFSTDSWSIRFPCETGEFSFRIMRLAVACVVRLLNMLHKSVRIARVGSFCIVVLKNF
jgi:hypothetical protein